MRRYQYRINDQQIAACTNGFLVPTSVHEVAPGETLSGAKQISFNSATLTDYILNRAFVDAYTFYVPFRILQDGFTDWLRTAGAEGTAPPLIATASQEGHFWEKADTNDTDASCVCWPRYAYNHIWNSFFRKSNAAEVSLAGNDLQKVSTRTSGFFTSEPEVDDTSHNIGTTVDSMREAVAKDQFNKLRKYYGDRYVDFLAAMGVSASWSILDEPELISKTQETMTINTTKRTDSSAGDLAGSFNTIHNHPLKKKFFPEHGLVMTVCSFTIQKLFKDSMPAMMAHLDPEDYWSPEYDMIKEKEYRERLWSDGTLVSDKVKLPNWEHLRKGTNLVTYETVLTDDTPAYVGIEDATGVESYKEGSYNPGASDIFSSFGVLPDGSGDADHMWSTISRLTKRSPVGPRGGSALR